MQHRWNAADSATPITVERDHGRRGTWLWRPWNACTGKDGNREFTRSEYMTRYHQEYPDRKDGSMLPSDYCVNLHPKGAERYPKFLDWLGPGRYQLLADAKTRVKSAPYKRANEPTSPRPSCW